MTDERIGKQLPIRADHAGHVTTVVRTAADIDKPAAYWLRCECGAEFLLGSYWLDVALARGSMLHPTEPEQRFHDREVNA
jgi:hypothetical protein